MVRILEVDTSKNTHSLALSIFTHSDLMSRLQKLHLSVKQDSMIILKPIFEKLKNSMRILVDKAVYELKIRTYKLLF